MRTIDRETLAWAAGFFEGEGTISASKQTGGYGYGINVAVYQTDREPLEQFGRVIGFGEVGIHVASASSFSRRPLFRWQVKSYERAQATVAMLWPWLSSRRREQATRVLLMVQGGWPARREWKEGAA